MMARRVKKRRRADGSIAGAGSSTDLPSIPPADPALFEEAVGVYRGNWKSIAENIDADHGDDLEVTVLLETILDLNEKHGETVGEPLAIRASYLCRMVIQSEQIKRLSSDKDLGIQAALRDAVCKMPMTAATGSRPLIHWLHKRGIKLPA